MRPVALTTALLTLTTSMAVASELTAHQVLIFAQNQCAGVPKVNPLQLQKPVLFGAAKAAYYYKNVVLAGDADGVQRFLSCYDLTTKARPDYASGRPIWAACQEIRGPGGERGMQMVCVAIDPQNEPLDPKIFSEEYADQVAGKIFNWF